MNQGLFSPEEVSTMIQKGDCLLLAGDHDLLSQLPKGNWIAGTTPYFMLFPEQRVNSYDKIFVSQLPDYISQTDIRVYDENTIGNIFNDAPENGFTILFIPFASLIYEDYALNATNYQNFAKKPVCGWICGRQLETIYEKSYAVSGADAVSFYDKAVAMHVTLPESKYAEIQIFNPYIQGKGDSIRFDYDGMLLTDALINGEKRNLAEYLREIKYDPTIPFVADYAGAMMNLTCCGFDETKTLMSAPVFKSVEYKLASIDPSIEEPELVDDRIVFSFTCIGNFLKQDICSQYLKKMNGPVVFGEIAYQLVNQTTVYVTVGDVSPDKYVEL